ncbi:short-chain dehydrogenase/reductase family 9C member 7-like [Ornithodoros turicata]|uniref:short-chain dehydrogenase/reductase family 9C member 7-like n=1 Tax=Ornithodoros turicata TaxID=34597 RepID=UPI003139803A
MSRQLQGPLVIFVFITMFLVITTALSPVLMSLLAMVGSIIVSLAVGLTYYRLSKAYLSTNLPVDRKAVFITGCDAGLGYCIAESLLAKGFDVFAGCLNVRSEGAITLADKDANVVHVDYLKLDTVVKGYSKVKNILGGKELWGIVANAGVTTYGEVEWLMPMELRWLVDVNVAGTISFIKEGISEVKKSRGRIVILTGLHGRLVIPGMVVPSATAATLSQFADGLRRELLKFEVQVCTIEPAFYRTRIMDHNNISAALTAVIDRLSSVVKEEYGGAYLNTYHFLYPKRLKRFARANISEVAAAVERSLLNRETNHRYQCCSMRQFLTWLMLESAPQQLRDFFLVKQFLPSVSVTGNITVRRTALKRVSVCSAETPPELGRILRPVSLYSTPPILQPGKVL